MAIQTKDFLTKLGAEACAGDYVVGTGEHRKHVANTVNGVPILNTEGMELLAIFESGGDLTAAITGQPQTEPEDKPARPARTRPAAKTDDPTVDVSEAQ